MADILIDKKKRNFQVSKYPGKPDILFDPSRRNFRLEQPDGGYGEIRMLGKFPDRKYWDRARRGESGGARGGFGIVPNAAGPDFNLSEVFGNRGMSGSGGQGRTPGGYSAYSQWRTSPEGKAEAIRNRMTERRGILENAMELERFKTNLQAQQPISLKRKEYNDYGAATGEAYDFYFPEFGNPEQPNRITGYKTIGGNQNKSVASTLLKGEDLAKLSDERKSQLYEQYGYMTPELQQQFQNEIKTMPGGRVVLDYFNAKMKARSGAIAGAGQAKTQPGSSVPTRTVPQRMTPAPVTPSPIQETFEYIPTHNVRRSSLNPLLGRFSSALKYPLRADARATGWVGSKLKVGDEMVNRKMSNLYRKFLNWQERQNY